jgi:DNA-binding MarR family transcriptional regulator
MRADVHELLPSMQQLFALKRLIGRKLSGSAQPGSFGVLAALSRTGELRLGDLAVMLHVHPSVVTRQVAELQTQGRVERRCDPGDGRASFVSLTPAGRHAVEDYFRRAEDLVASALERWQPDEVSVLARLTQRLRDDLEAAVTESVAEPAFEPVG